jgi:hypothetical protein
VVVTLRPPLLVVPALVLDGGLEDEVAFEEELLEEPQPEMSDSAAMAAGMARHLPICPRTLA